MKKRLRRGQRIAVREKHLFGRKLFADEEAIETLCESAGTTACPNAGSYSLMKKRLRRNLEHHIGSERSLAGSYSLMKKRLRRRSAHPEDRIVGRRKLFADEEAIETRIACSRRSRDDCAGSYSLMKKRLRL